MKAPLTPQMPTSMRRNFRRLGDLVTRMPLRKVIQGHPGRWTITDANLSPDNERYYSDTFLVMKLSHDFGFKG